MVGVRRFIAVCALGVASTIPAAEEAQAQRYVLTTDVSGFKLKSDASAAALTGPRGSVFQILNRGQGQDIYTVRFARVAAPVTSADTAHLRNMAGVAGDAASRSMALVAANVDYEILSANLPQYDYRMRTGGFAAGILDVPFKFQLRGLSGVTPGGTVGPFGGWRFPTFAPTTLLLAVGATTITTPTTSDPSPHTATGLGVGLGLVFEPLSSGQAFQIGVVLGLDFVDKAYAHNGELWLSVAMGYKFTH